MNGDNGEEEAYYPLGAGEWMSEWVGEWVSEWVGGWASEWVSEWVHDWCSLSLSEDNAVDNNNSVGEDHQHLEETFNDFDQHPLDTHDTSHDIDPMGKPLSLYIQDSITSVCVSFIVLQHLVERR